MSRIQTVTLKPCVEQSKKLNFTLYVLELTAKFCPSIFATSLAMTIRFWLVFLTYWQNDLEIFQNVKFGLEFLTYWQNDLEIVQNVKQNEKCAKKTIWRGGGGTHWSYWPKKRINRHNRHCPLQCYRIFKNFGLNIMIQHSQNIKTCNIGKPHTDNLFWANI